MDKQEIRARLLRAVGKPEARLNTMQDEALGCASPALTLLAPTGSGKTLAFASRVLQSLPGRALVLVPSRELAVQVAGVLRAAAKGEKVTALYGGHPMAYEKAQLTPEPAILVATPGRLADHITRGNIDPSAFSTLVIDEYDKMLELGFEKEMRKIVRGTGHLKSLTLTSATPMDTLPAFLPKMSGPVLNFLGEKGTPAPSPEIVEVTSFTPDKLDTLADVLLSRPTDSPAIIFVNHRESATRVAERLRGLSLPVGLYHGALEQADRENALEMFANGTTPLLVATDLAARGLDIPQVETVIHYHLPVDAEAWTHRNGRTARQGTPGTVMVIVSEHDTVPDYIKFDRQAQPSPIAGRQAIPSRATLYFNLGRRDKISRGDILGFLTGPGHLEGAEVGRITVRDRCALAAVPAAKAGRTIANLSQERLKGKRVKTTRLQPPA